MTRAANGSLEHSSKKKEVQGIKEKLIERWFLITYSFTVVLEGSKFRLRHHVIFLRRIPSKLIIFRILRSNAFKNIIRLAEFSSSIKKYEGHFLNLRDSKR